MLLATRLFNGGAGRPKPGVITQGEDDGVAERENRRLGFGASLGKWIRRPSARIIWLDDGFRGVNVQVRGNRAAVTAASETSGGMGKGRCQEAQPARKRRGMSTPVRHSSLRGLRHGAVARDAEFRN